MTMTGVLDAAPLPVLARHIPNAVLWACLADAAATGKLDVKGRAATDAGKRWLTGARFTAADPSYPRTRSSA